MDETVGNPTPAGTIRAAWASGRTTFGIWSTLGCEHVVEILARCRFDWVGIDLQHGMADPGRLPSLLRALNITGTPSLVRVSWNAPDQIMRALDAGADGVIVPMVSSASEALAAVAACRYPPDGIRSWGPTRPSLLTRGYSPEFANRDVICAVMAETNEAVDSIDSIVSVRGIDAVFVGPMDLGLSLGEDGRNARSDGTLGAQIDRIRAACARGGVAAGVFAGGSRSAVEWADRGFAIVSTGPDAALLRRAASDLASAIGTARPVDGDPPDYG